MKYCKECYYFKSNKCYINPPMPLIWSRKVKPDRQRCCGFLDRVQQNSEDSLYYTNDQEENTLHDLGQDFKRYNGEKDIGDKKEDDNLEKARWGFLGARCGDKDENIDTILHPDERYIAHNAEGDIDVALNNKRIKAQKKCSESINKRIEELEKSGKATDCSGTILARKE